MADKREIEMFSPEEMLSPFEAIKETDAEGREWWNSRKLARLIVMFSGKTVWLSQKRMSDLFNVALSTINYHLTQLEESGELQLSAVIRNFRIPSDNCDEPGVMMYNLDAIIAVGNRVNSYEATQFRIWARGVLKEFIIKGFVMDDVEECT